MRRVDPRRLVFLDESGANVSMGRTHAWIQKGEILVDPRPMNWGNNLSTIGAVRCDRWLTMSTMFKSANRERFVQSVRRRLLRRIRPGDIVVLDNAQAHKDRAARPPTALARGRR